MTTTLSSEELKHRLDWMIACEGTDQYEKARLDFLDAVRGWL